MRYNYHKKILILSLLTVIVFIISYQLGFKKTIILRREYHSNIQLLQKVTSAPILLSQLIKQRNSIESSYGLFSDNLQAQEKLLDKVDQFNSSLKSVKVVELSEPVFSSVEDFTVCNQQIVLQGKFQNLVEYLRLLEDDYSLGQINSAEFYKVKEARSKKEVLYMKLFIQSIMK
jgi:hypothetical protein